MKRRVLVVRTLTTAFSATVFGATGWLMGTRTLTMPPPQCEGVDPCNGDICGQQCWFYGVTCHKDNCIYGICRPYRTYGLGCWPTQPSCACICGFDTQIQNCGDSPCTSECIQN